MLEKKLIRGAVKLAPASAPIPRVLESNFLYQIAQLLAEVFAQLKEMFWAMR